LIDRFSPQENVDFQKILAIGETQQQTHGQERPLIQFTGVSFQRHGADKEGCRVDLEDKWRVTLAFLGA
jgi:hypothetical protein